MYKKALSLILGAVLLGSLVPVSVAADEIGVGEGETVTIWECNWGGENYESTLQKLAAEATEANIDGKGYKVEVTMIPWDNYYESFMTAVTAGTAPDIAYNASTSPYQYYLMGETIDLTPIYDQWVEEGNKIVEEIPESAWNFDRFDGVLVGIPIAVDGIGMVYRKDIFEAAGIEALPQTWDELEQVCQKLLDYGVTPIVFEGATTSNLGSVSELFLTGNDTGVVDKEYNNTIMSDKNQETYAFLKDLFEKGYIAEGVLGYTLADAQRIFINGDAAILISHAPSFADTEELQEKIGIMDVIQGPSAPAPQSSASYQSIYAYNQGGHDEATLAVLKWWVEHNTIEYTEGGCANIPSYSSQMDETITNPLVKEFAMTWCIENAKPAVHPLENFAPFSAALDSSGTSGDVMQAILAHGDVTEASEKLADKVDEIVAESLEE